MYDGEGKIVIKGRCMIIRAGMHKMIFQKRRRREKAVRSPVH
jgi:hypothetical protein